MKTLTLIIVAAFISISLNAQIVFEKTYGGSGYNDSRCVQQTSDGGYIIAGSAELSLGNSDIYLIKTNANGDTAWTKTFGGANDADVGFAGQQTTDGGYIVTGISGNAAEGIYLIKTNAVGGTLWTKTFGGFIAAYFVQQADGGYIIVGYTNSFGAGGSDVYVIKTDANGDTLWTKTFGGASDDIGTYIQHTNDNGYIIAGVTNSFGAGGGDIYLIKTDANGDTLWTKTFGGISIDEANAVLQTTDGGYIIVGNTGSSGAGGADVYLIKTDANGNSQWTKTFGGASHDYGSSIQATSGGGYIIGGYTISSGAGGFDVYLIKTNDSGDTLWTKTFGTANNDFGYSLQQTGDGGYVIAGITGSASAADVYLIKTDCKGNQLSWDVNCPVTAVAEMASSMIPSVNVYPNPSSDFTTITINNIIPDEAKYWSITLFDVLGKQIELHQEISTTQNSIEIRIENNELLVGIYFFNVMNDGKVFGSGKLNYAGR